MASLSLTREVVMRAMLLQVLILVFMVSGCERRTDNGGAVTDTLPTSDSGAASGTVRGKPEILSVTVRVRTSEGREGNIEIKQDSTDAVFLSMAAFDKFAAPFYAKLKNEGPDSVAAMRRKAKDQLDKYGIIIIVHKLKCKMLLPEGRLGGKFPFKL